MKQEILFEEKVGKNGNLGVITLNRPEVLNSLNHHMIHQLHDQLKTWSSKKDIKAVVIKAAEGRAFCAGGDIRLTYERMKANDSKMLQFFHDEYLLNRCIFHFPKPYIALLDGITMGGGVGISIHGSHRVATERLLFAMPETGIGFFPDVGGTYFLPRLLDNIGIYLGLTGARVTSDDCVAIQLVQTKIARESLSELVDALAQTTFIGEHKTAVTKIIEQFQIPAQSSPLLEKKALINKLFSAGGMEEILFALQKTEDEFCKKTVDELLKKSPTSLKVTLRALQVGKNLHFDECMSQEYRLVSHFLQGHDFMEGIRAAIIHKDQKPHWQPDSLQKVTEEVVENYFSPIPHELVQ